MDWDQVKEMIAQWTGLERDALHIYAAILIQIATAALVRRSMANLLPWFCVLIFALGNEWVDMHADHLVEDWEQPAALHDLWNTMLLPTILMLLARFAPTLTVGRPPTVARDERASREA